MVARYMFRDQSNLGKFLIECYLLLELNNLL
jgi:hypothetical protein